jgi:hypothetical protein
MYYRGEAFYYALLWAKGPDAKDILKQMFSIYGGDCLSRKAVDNWVENFSKDVRKSRMMPDQVQKWLRQQSKLLCCGFRRIGKAMGQVYQCLWRICREMNVFSSFEYHMFYVLYQFVAYLLALLRICKP